MSRASRGFTLIELMVTLTVFVVLALLAVPSFQDFRQRAALRGAADQMSSFWGNARFEAIKRDALVKVAFRSGAAGYCLGADLATGTADDTPCDCFTPGSCTIATYPASQSEWRGVRVASNPTLGEGDGTTADGVVVIDPKRGGLTESADEGRILLQGPTGPRDYRLNLVIDRNGRALQCEPTDAPTKLSDYADRRC